MTTLSSIITPTNLVTLTGAATLTNKTLVAPALGTPSSGTLTNATGLPPAGVTGTAAILGANTFTALQTMPAVKITTGAGAAKVLTSAADGAATWETLVAGLGAASQAEAEAATSNAVAITPLSAKWHPGVAKAWLCVGNSGNILASHNITSVTDAATGVVDVVIGVDFSSSAYAVVASAGVNGALASINCRLIAATGFTMQSRNDAGALVDPESYSATCFGDQA